MNLSTNIVDTEMLRSSHMEVFCKKDALKSFAKFTGKHMCESLFFNKAAGLRSPDLLYRTPPMAAS